MQYNLFEGNLLQYHSGNTAVSLGTGKVWHTKLPEKLYMDLTKKPSKVSCLFSLQYVKAFSFWDNFSIGGTTFTNILERLSALLNSHR